MDISTLRQHLLIFDSKESGYLPTECLVHIVREAKRDGSDECAVGMRILHPL